MRVEVLQQKLDSRGWHAYELSKRAGLNHVTIGNLLNGVASNPKFDTVVKIATALDCSLDDFR